MPDPDQSRAPKQRPLSDEARRLVAAVESLGVEHAFEHSFKLFPGAILEDRFLMGFRPSAVGDRERIVDLCRSLDMPGDLREAFASRLAEATVVLFGYEKDEAIGLYKTYLEFGGGFERLAPGGDDLTETFTIHHGFKWDASNPERHAMARYTCYPRFGLRDMLERLETDFYEDHPETLQRVRRLALLAEARTDHDRFLYAEVGEAGNPRRSYDMNLYQAGLTFRELKAPVAALFDHYGIPADDFDRIHESLRTTTFGHLSGGIDRQGRDFLTLYFAVTGPGEPR